MYSQEKLEALDFLSKFKYYPVVENVIDEIRSKQYMHSDRWSIVYDMIDAAFPEYKNTGVVTGLVYLVEQGEI